MTTGTCMEYGVVYEHMSARNYRLNHLLNTAPPNSVIILEDIDAAFGSRADPMENHPAYQGMTR